MTAPTIFLAGLAATLAASLIVVAYLRPHLRFILVDLCGTAERASFWVAFSNVTLVLVPLIFSMQFRPEGDEGVSPILMVRQLEWALIGLVASLVILAAVIGSFVPRRPGAGGTG